MNFLCDLVHVFFFFFIYVLWYFYFFIFHVYLFQRGVELISKFITFFIN